MVNADFPKVLSTFFTVSPLQRFWFFVIILLLGGNCFNDGLLANDIDDVLRFLLQEGRFRGVVVNFTSCMVFLLMPPPPLSSWVIVFSAVLWWRVTNEDGKYEMMDQQMKWCQTSQISKPISCDPVQHLAGQVYSEITKWCEKYKLNKRKYRQM